MAFVFCRASLVTCRFIFFCSSVVDLLTGQGGGGLLGGSGRSLERVLRLGECTGGGPEGGGGAWLRFCWVCGVDLKGGLD